MYVYWEYELSRILWATPHIFPLSNHVQLFLWNSCISHPDKHVNHTSIENAKHMMSRCVFSFFTLSLLIVNIDLDSFIWSHWQFLNTNIRTFLHHLFVFTLDYALRERPLLVVDRGWCLEIAASVKRQFEVRRHVLVGGTLPCTICDTVIQGKEPCRSEKKY